MLRQQLLAGLQDVVLADEAPQDTDDEDQPQPTRAEMEDVLEAAAQHVAARQRVLDYTVSFQNVVLREVVQAGERAAAAANGAPWAIASEGMRV